MRTRGWGIGVLLPVVVVGAAATTVMPASAQDAVSAARLSAILHDDGGAEVLIGYRVDGATAGSSVDLAVLIPEGVDISEVTTTEGQAVRLAPQSGMRRTATVAVGTGGSLGLRYDVRDAVRIEDAEVYARLPVVGVSLPPAEGSEVFEVSLTIPDDWTVSEGFPTGLRVTEDGTFGVSLPVVPSVVTVRGRTDGAWRPGLSLLAELVTLLVAGTFGFFGWRHLRRVAA